MEHSRIGLEEWIEVVVVAIHGCYEFSSSEPELGAAAPWDEDGGVVDGDGDHLFSGKNEVFVPEWRRELRVS
ncbi:hypothetical protein PHLCEN_2v10428 [Hermanssonia centrifuga]|uniref:Uncharacterized protein n=1 Tax=Hermanssonia centrifuga TaxID=98765 RepID=A0A2R6NMX2_9APHY|nr:hypothetical protein PHLCEN_2v10428 [Hermanssonia centrifuga]